MRHALFLVVVIFLFSVSPNAYSHQPVMDMAPRWQGGYGFQLRYETFGSKILMDGDSEIANPGNLKRHINKTWFEGVYTFDRSKRITFKLPFIRQYRTLSLDNFSVKQNNSGAGDLIIGFPIKKYFNRGAETGNWAFTPSIRIPTGSTAGDFPISDGSWDLGLSFSYSNESFKFYQLYDLYYWRNTEGRHNMREGDEIGLDINWGIHPFHNNNTNSGMFLMWDISAHHQDKPGTLTPVNGGTRIHTGPAIILYRETVMFRAEYKMIAYEKLDNIGNSKGDIVQIGIGVTF